MEKLQYFNLVMALLTSVGLDKLDPTNFYSTDASAKDCLLDNLVSVQNLRSHQKTEFTDYFALAKAIEASNRPLYEKAHMQTFITTPFTVIHLNTVPLILELSIDQAI